MITIILAAGQGKRLRPYTNEIPKCMVPLGGKSILHWQLQTLEKCGIYKNIIIVGGYKHNKIQTRGHRKVLNKNFMSTNMASTLFCAKEYIKNDEDLLICYGDIVYQPNVLKKLLKEKFPINIAADKSWKKLWNLRMEEPLEDAETFKLDKNQLVLELGRKPKSYQDIEAQYIGLIYIKAEYVKKFSKFYNALNRDAIYDGEKFNNLYMTSLLQRMIDNGWKIKASLVNNGWLEVDTYEELLRYNEMIDKNIINEVCNVFDNF